MALSAVLPPLLLLQPVNAGSTMIGEEEVDDVHYQMMQWNSFAAAWDEIIDDLRMGDLVSDKEAAMLKFVRLDLGSRSYGLRPILLPTFFYAGQVRKVGSGGEAGGQGGRILLASKGACRKQGRGLQEEFLWVVVLSRGLWAPPLVYYAILPLPCHFITCLLTASAPPLPSGGH